MKPAVWETVAAFRQWRAGVRGAGETLGLVPTMGALHAGHEALLARARRENDRVAASIFVNPTQFNDPRDYSRYPRSLEHDLAVCEKHGVEAVFCPGETEMYPPGAQTFVDAPAVTEHLCGRFRPGHFRGVATVVAKLFHIVEPERAYFGEKDAQQLALIRTVVRDLNLPIEIVAVPTVREADGLALSSRNRLLSAGQRRAAPRLYQSLQAARGAIAAGESDAARACAAGRKVLEQEPGIRVEYFETVDPLTMRPVEKISAPVLIAAAVWLGEVRLIDNLAAGPAVEFSPPAGNGP